jgi:hypothetical protein
VVIGHLDVVGVTIAPLKANAPAVIDPKAVLSCSIPRQLFEAIGQGALQIRERMGIVQHAQLPQSDLLDVRWQPSGTLASENLLGLTILE